MRNPTSHPIEITCSRGFLEWLDQEHVSLAFTTYQTNRLFLLGLKPNGELSTFERLFDRPMGLYSTPSTGLRAGADRLYVGCRYQIWRLDNALPPGQTHDGYDALYVPRRSFTTGDVDVHDVKLDKNGRLIFVNTLHSCLATVSDRYSFKPFWQPPFISRLAPEDRCHLNGLALDDGQPRYATAVSRSDVFAGWRKRREEGGILMDIQSNEILLDSLSMPHSPRVHDGKLWLLNAGTGDFGIVDLEKGIFEPLAFCPGYMRGLAFHGHYAIIGLSKPRRVKAFEGLSLDEKLEAKGAEAMCGLAVVDLNTGNIAHWLEVEGIISELYDVKVLPGVRRPMSLGFKTDEISRFVTIEYQDGPVFQQLKASPDAQITPIDFLALQQQTAPLPGAAPPVPTFHPPSPIADYRFHLSFDMSVAAAIQSYNHLTFPNLGQRAGGRPFREPLITAAAALEGEFVGLAVAEIQADGRGANLVSCFVAAPHRRRRIATRLLAHLQRALAQRGYHYLDLAYSQDWPSLPVVEHMLNKHGWLPPQTRLYQYKVAILGRAPWLYDERATLPPGFSTFDWTDLTAAERDAIRQKQADGEWVLPRLNPFQVQDYLEPRTSLGLRYQGEVVGWMVTHRFAPDAIQYTSLFLSPEHRGQRVALPLLAASLHRHLEGGVPYGIWQVEADNEAMLAFVRRYLQPYIAKQTELRVSRKLLHKGNVY